MSLNKGYSVHAEIKNTLAEINDNEDAFRLTKAAQKFLTIATTLIYYSFTSVIFAGVSVWAFQAYVFGNATNVNGLLFTIALVVSTPIGLALAKHSNFQAMARAPDIRVFIIRALIALAILTGIWYEAISSSSNLQEKAFHAVENSKAGNGIINSGVTITAGSNTALSDAEFKLVSCERKLKEGSVKDCLNSQARVNSLKEQAALDRKAVGDANVQAITAKQAALDKERDSHALPAAKAFSGWFNTSLAAGTFIIVIISSLFFELIHLSTVYSERNNLMQGTGLNRHLQNLKTEYFNLVGKPYSPNDFKDDKVLDMQELRESGAIPDFKEGAFTGSTWGGGRFEDGNPSLSDDDDPAYKITTKGVPYEDTKIGFGTPKTANLFKWQQQEKPLHAPPEKVVGFLRQGQTAQPSASLDTENRRLYPQQILYPTGNGKTADDYALIPRVDRKHPTPHVENGKDSAALASLQLPVLQLPVGESVNSGKSSVYAMAEQAKVGQVIACPCCGKSFTKANKWHLFCSNNRKPREDGGNCSDDWHNAQNPERLAAAQAKARKRRG